MRNNPLDEALVTGWKRIARYMGVSVRTAQRMEKEYGMPLLRFPSGRPVVIRGEIPLWLIEYDRLKRERKQKEQARDSGAG